MSTDTLLFNDTPIVSNDPYQRFSDDPCKNKHHGNRESRIAWELVLQKLTETQEDVLAIIQEAHPEPITAKEVASVLGKPFHSVSGRCTELKEQGLVEKSEIVRDGSRALRLATGLPALRKVNNG
jgi:predicted Rossmann fold nucleotide-binding protein DprA/Smf involved in DNA uptake